MKETKVYVDELPESCWECPCFKDDIDFPCGLSDGTQDYFRDGIDGENCPLHSIKDHDRELVKEVCEKIRKTIISTVDLAESNQQIKDQFHIILDLVEKEVEDE